MFWGDYWNCIFLFTISILQIKAFPYCLTIIFNVNNVYKTNRTTIWYNLLLLKNTKFNVLCFTVIQTKASRRFLDNADKFLHLEILIKTRIKKCCHSKYWLFGVNSPTSSLRHKYVKFQIQIWSFLDNFALSPTFEI